MIGCGAWGRNLVRTFHALPGARLVTACDLDEGRLAQMRSSFPGLKTGAEPAAAIAERDVEAVVIAASASAHKDLALAAFAAGKHVFVEKPLALSSSDAREVVAAARRAGRTLMVGHLLLHHPAVAYIKRLVDQGELGDLRYMYSLRVNLGAVRRDENALWSFGPHDVSVMDHLMGARPESVSARGQAWLQPGVEDVVFVNLRYPGGRMGQIQLSWLDPCKTRRLTIVGTRKMAVFDDGEVSEKVRIYDRGAAAPPEYATYGEYLGLRHGDVVIPRIDASEPLRNEALHFVDCVRGSAAPRTPGEQGVEVVEVLEAASESLRRDGAPVAVGAGGTTR